MNWRIAGFAALGCGTLAVAIFAALAISGYQLAHSYMPVATPAPSQATQDPHIPVSLLSREQLRGVMPPPPAGSRFIAEQYLANAYCLDDCPTFTRQYDVPGGLTSACVALIAIRGAYLRQGYAPAASYYPHPFPTSIHDCRASARKMPTLEFDARFVKDTSPTSEMQFTAEVRIAGDKFTITTRYF